MFYDKVKTIKACEEDPSLIFEVIKEGYFELVEEIIDKHKVDINTTDDAGNDVICRLLKAKQYELTLKYMKKRNWNINHQNKDGNTFAHILASINYVNVIEIINSLNRNKKFIPNIKNNKGETILDKAINENYIYTSVQILKNNRFNNIDIVSFKHLFDTYIKGTYYGKYAKLNNLEVIVDSLTKKDFLLPSMEKLLDLIVDNMDNIKQDLLKNKSRELEAMINSLLLEAAS